MPRYVYGIRQCNIVPVEAQMRKIEEERRGSQHSPDNEIFSEITNRINMWCAMLCQDVLEFCIDYFRLHQSCQIMLGMIRDELQVFDMRKITNVSLEDARPLPVLTIAVLRCMADLSDYEEIREDSTDACASKHLAREIVQTTATCIETVSCVESTSLNCCIGEVSCQQLSRLCNVNIPFQLSEN